MKRAKTSSFLASAVESAPSKLLKQWREYCCLQALMHRASRGHFKVINHALSITSMLLGSFSSLTVIGVAGNISNERPTMEQYYYSIVIISMGVAGVVASTLASVHKLLGVAELQREHDLYSDMFENLTNDIDMQLVLDSNAALARMFVNTGEFLKYCKHRLDLLIDKAPPIPGVILRRAAAGQESRSCELVSVHVCQTPSHKRKARRPLRSMSSPDVCSPSASADAVRANATLLWHANT